MIKVRTNRAWRPFKHRSEVPAKVLASEFDWLPASEDAEDADDGFFCYRGEWFHRSQFMRTEPGGELERAGWHGYAGDSYWTGTVLELSDDASEYRVGSYRVVSEDKPAITSPGGLLIEALHGTAEEQARALVGRFV